MSLLSRINGYKTYLISAAMIAYAVTGFFLGHIDGNTAVEMILQALGLSALRSGVAKL